MAKAKKNMSNTSLITKQFYNIARGNVSHTKLQKLQHHRNDSIKRSWVTCAKTTWTNFCIKTGLSNKKWKCENKTVGFLKKENSK